jgi:hypothetical protein
LVAESTAQPSMQRMLLSIISTERHESGVGVAERLLAPRPVAPLAFRIEVVGGPGIMVSRIAETNGFAVTLFDGFPLPLPNRCTDGGRLSSLAPGRSDLSARVARTIWLAREDAVHGM